MKASLSMGTLHVATTLDIAPHGIYDRNIDGTIQIAKDDTTHLDLFPA